MLKYIHLSPLSFSVCVYNVCIQMDIRTKNTANPRLTDCSTYRLFELQTSLVTKFRFDLQPENRPTDQKITKMEQKWNKNGRLWD